MPFDPLRVLLSSSVAIALTVIPAGCSEATEPEATTTHADADHDHDHSDGDHDHGHTHGDDDHGHDHGDDGHGDDGHGDDDGHDHDEDHGHGHDHGDASDSVTFNVGDSVLRAPRQTDVEPGTTLYFDVYHLGGAMPEALELWVGTEDGAGSVKSQALAHGDHFHVDVAVPASFGDGMKLWIAITNDAGETARHGLPLD